MGALAEFIAAEFKHEAKAAETKNDTSLAAKVANPAKVQASFSNFSNFSRAANSKSAHYCACGAPASVAHGWFLQDQSKARWYCASCLPPKGMA